MQPNKSAQPPRPATARGLSQQDSVPNQSIPARSRPGPERFYRRIDFWTLFFTILCTVAAWLALKPIFLVDQEKPQQDTATLQSLQPPQLLTTKSIPASQPLVTPAATNTPNATPAEPAPPQTILAGKWTGQYTCSTRGALEYHGISLNIALSEFGTISGFFSYKTVDADYAKLPDKPFSVTGTFNPGPGTLILATNFPSPRNAVYPRQYELSLKNEVPGDPILLGSVTSWIDYSPCESNVVQLRRSRSP